MLKEYLKNTEQIQIDVRQKLKEAVQENLAELQRANEEQSLSTVAWRARNLLELDIWTVYCNISEENAKRFLLDSTRDAADMLNIRDGLLSKSASFMATRRELIEQAEEDGIEIEKSFMRTSKAAEVIGNKELFSTVNKVLSKLAHPTAMNVMGYDKAAGDILRKQFVDMGQLMGNEALRILGQPPKLWGVRNHDHIRRTSKAPQ